MIPIIADFETFYGDDYTLTSMPTEAYIRDERFKAHGIGIKLKANPSFWVTGRMLPAFLPKLKLHENALVGHNLNFDGFILYHHYGIRPKMYLDTLGMSRALVGPHSTRHGLKYISMLLCGMTKMDELEKVRGVRDLSPAQEAAIADYCCGAPRPGRKWNKDAGCEEDVIYAGDTELTYHIFKELIKHFPKGELYGLHWINDNFCKPGLMLDAELLRDYLAYVLQQKEQALVDAGLDNRDTLMSNPKFAEALETLGVRPPTKINARGKVTFAFAKTDPGLQELLEHDDPRVQAIVAARLTVKSTIEETRTKRFLSAAQRGEFPTPYNFSGAMVTHRISGADKYNLTNMARAKYDVQGNEIPNTGMLRKSIYAPEGYEIGVADLSQIEARITLWLGMQLTGASPGNAEYDSLEIMRLNGDLYSWFGSRIYGYEINKKTHPTERQIAKSAVLGLGYGMGPSRFIDYCKTMNIPMDAIFAQNVVDLYRGTYVGVRKFWSQCTRAIEAMLDGRYGYTLPFDGIGLVTTGTDPIFNEPAILLPGGLCVKYPKLRKDTDGQIWYTQGAMSSRLFGGKVCENIVQAVAAYLIRQMKAEVDTVYPVKLETYDELAMLVPEGGKSEWENFILPIMTRERPELPGLPIGVEHDMAIRYGDAK